MKKLFCIFCFCAILAPPAQAAVVKRQIFFGTGLVAPFEGTKAVSTIGGIAAILPISSRVFLRPLVGAGANWPLNGGSAVPLLQAGTLLGFKANAHVSLLVGGAMIASFPADKPVAIVPTALFSSAIRLTPHWGIFTPIAVNKKAAGLQVQVGYTW